MTELGTQAAIYSATSRAQANQKFALARETAKLEHEQRVLAIKTQQDQLEIQAQQEQIQRDQLLQENAVQYQNTLNSLREQRIAVQNKAMAGESQRLQNVAQENLTSTAENEALKNTLMQSITQQQALPKINGGITVTQNTAQQKQLSQQIEAAQNATQAVNGVFSDQGVNAQNLNDINKATSALDQIEQLLGNTVLDQNQANAQNVYNTNNAAVKNQDILNQQLRQQALDALNGGIGSSGKVRDQTLADINRLQRKSITPLGAPGAGYTNSTMNTGINEITPDYSPKRSNGTSQLPSPFSVQETVGANNQKFTNYTGDKVKQQGDPFANWVGIQIPIKDPVTGKISIASSNPKTGESSVKNTNSTKIPTNLNQGRNSWNVTIPKK